MNDAELLRYADGLDRKKWREACVCGAATMEQCGCLTCDCCGRLKAGWSLTVDATGERNFCQTCASVCHMDSKGNVDEAAFQRRRSR